MRRRLFHSPLLSTRALTPRTSHVRLRQLELQRTAIEEHRRERDQAVGALRRAELSFEQRCANLQATHEGKCLMLYAKVPLDAGALASLPFPSRHKLEFS